VDNKQFIHKLLSDPSDPQLQSETDGECSASIHNIQKQDYRVRNALEVPVPPELLTRLLDQQRRLEAQDRQPSWFSEYWKAGIAASVAFAIGLSFSVLQTPAQQDLAQYALAHVRSEMPMVEKMLMPQPLDGVNAKLAAYDLKLNDFPESIMFAKFCDFNGTKSLHLVMKTSLGFVTIFVVPADAKLDFVEQFSDPRYAGTSLKLRTANVVVVSDVPAELSRMPALVKEKLTYSI
jgi:hypothetical protein